MKAKVGIIGDGGWGTAVAVHLDALKHEVTVWGAFPDYISEMKKSRLNKRYLPGYQLKKSIQLTSDLQKTIEENEIIVLAIPTPFIRSVIKKCQGINLKGKVFVNLSKGIENKTLSFATDIVKEYLPQASVAVLSGPSHAEEVVRGAPTCVVIASKSPAHAKKLQKVFSSKMFRVYTSSDVLGVQIGGAVKNVIAIAAGICDGLNYGDNTKSALLARGLAEMTRLGMKLGAKKDTFAGLSGLGDLATTCFSPHGRNRAVGEKIGKGIKLKAILATTQTVAEGVRTAKSVYELSRKVKIDMPICDEIYKVLYRNKSPQKALYDLMLRDHKSE